MRWVAIKEMSAFKPDLHDGIFTCVVEYHNSKKLSYSQLEPVASISFLLLLVLVDRNYTFFSLKVISPVLNVDKSMN